jgi:hypothetical protein
LELGQCRIKQRGGAGDRFCPIGYSWHRYDLVLSITWRAINRQAVAAENQAEASRALIGAAEQQTKATAEAAAAAKEQRRLLALQYGQNLAPLIVARLVLKAPSHTLLKLKNVGIGAAFGVVVFTCKVDLSATNMTYPSTGFSPFYLGSG